MTDRKTQRVTSEGLRDIFRSDGEFAVLDVRERNPYSKAHVLMSSCVPLSQLELSIGDMVPRLSTKIVVVDDGPSDPYKLAERAANRLGELGYTDVSILEGGIDGWRDAGLELFEGVGSYSKAFGEWIAEEYHTPYVTAQEEHDRAAKKENQVILDCRPKNEYHRMTIPGSVNAPGADLVYRVHDAAPDPDSVVVVHCAGRTRSIIGCQSLVNAGIPNPVVALENGTMGWQLAGFELEYEQTHLAPSPSAEGLAKAKECSERLIERFGVRKVSYETVRTWMAQGKERTTYVIDIRLPEEFACGYVEGSRNVQGGQLVQATDEFVSVFNARIVLMDDTEVRAVMTASWLIQLGWSEVYVLENGISGLQLTMPSTKPGKQYPRGTNTLKPQELAKLLEDPQTKVAVVDVGSSVHYKEKHIPGAWWGIRSRLHVDCANLPQVQRLVLTSEDGTLAHLASRDLEGWDSGPRISVLEGGTKAWIKDGLPISSGMELAISELDDAWYMPYMHPDAPEEAKRAYFAWELGLVAQVKREGTAKFLAV